MAFFIRILKNVESLGLGRKSLGFNTDTETWSWFWFPIPKCGLGPERILILNTDTSVFFAYWCLFSILQIEYWYWYFSIWKSYWILVFSFCTGQVSAIMSTWLISIWFQSTTKCTYYLTEDVCFKLSLNLSCSVVLQCENLRNEEIPFHWNSVHLLNSCHTGIRKILDCI